MAGGSAEKNGPKRKKRRAYLDDFHRDLNGEYHYEGRHVRYCGVVPRRKFLLRLWLLTGGGAALLLGCGCMPGATTGAPVYAALPFMLALVMMGLCVYALARAAAGGDPMRLYVYEQTVKRLPARYMLAAVLAGVSAVGHGAWLAAAEREFFVWNAAFLAASVLAAACSFCAFVLVQRTEFELQ